MLEYFSGKFRISITLTIKIMEENEAVRDCVSLSVQSSASNKQRALIAIGAPPSLPPSLTQLHTFYNFVVILSDTVSFHALRSRIFVMTAVLR